MKTFTATEAKNRFGELLEASASEPVAIQKNGRDLRIILSAEEYSRLVESRGEKVRPVVKELLARSMKRRKAVYEALAK